MVDVVLHAYNLINPSHMEWTNDQRLLVSEHTTGRIRDVTAGGDMANATPFAYGLEGPAAIVPMQDGRILVSETWGGRVKDIASGGDQSATIPFAQGLSLPYSLLAREIDRKIRLFVSQLNYGINSWISDITTGGDPSGHSIYVNNIPARPGAPGLTPASAWPKWQTFAAAGCPINWQGGGTFAHYAAIGPLGQIMDITNSGGEYVDLLKTDRCVAWGLHRLGAIKEHPKNGLVYAVEPEEGNVIAINPKERKNYRFEPPVLRGFVMPSCVRFSHDGSVMYVCSQGDGVVWKVTSFIGS